MKPLFARRGNCGELGEVICSKSHSQIESGRLASDSDHSTTHSAFWLLMLWNGSLDPKGKGILGKGEKANIAQHLL